MCTLAAWWCKGWWCKIGGPLWCKGWWCKGASSKWEILRVSNVLALHEAEAEMHVRPVSKFIWRSGVSSYESCVVGPRVAPGRVSDIVSMFLTGILWQSSCFVHLPNAVFHTAFRTLFLRVS